MPPKDNSLDTMLGRRLRRLRKAGGLTQAALAERLGVTFQQVQKYERGVNRISASTLMRAAQALDVAPTALLAGQDPAEDAADAKLVTIAPGAEQLLDAYTRIASPQQRRALVRLACDMASTAEAAAKPAT